jgi:hypothetical protein
LLLLRHCLRSPRCAPPVFLRFLADKLESELHREGRDISIYDAPSDVLAALYGFPCPGLVSLQDRPETEPRGLDSKNQNNILSKIARKVGRIRKLYGKDSM